MKNDGGLVNFHIVSGILKMKMSAINNGTI